MFKRLSIATAMVLLGSVITNAGQAEAIVYEFSNWDPGNTGTLSASGFFDINDTGDGVVDFSSEVSDFSIVFTESGTNVFTMTPSNSFVISSNLTGVSVDNSRLDFSTAVGGELWYFDTAIFGYEFYVGPTNEEYISILSGASSSHDLSSGDAPTLLAFSSASSPTSGSVPFEFSPSLGLLAVGGIFGVSQLRKKVAARKLISKELA